VNITDRPDMKFRGFYVEGAGHSANSEELRRLIRDTYSYFKANAVVLELRWSDFRWRSHPEVAGPNALPVDDLVSIARYARRYDRGCGRCPCGPVSCCDFLVVCRLVSDF
jgi:hypothetical protein